MHWREFFRHEAPRYEEECFVQNTEAELAFLIEELRLPPGARILDVGCGTGRHAVGLAQAGYAVTGVDLSAEMLAIARTKAAARGVTVEFVQEDATRYVSDPCFDAAVGLCEGALCLLDETDDPVERDVTVLRNIHSALKPGGRLVINALNAFRVARLAGREPDAPNFDVMTQTTVSDVTLESPEGPVTIPCRERYYTPTEFGLLLRLAGFQPESIWGGTAGNWRRGPLDLDEFELMAVARKP